MSSVARPQIDDVSSTPAPPVKDAGKIERPFAEDTPEKDSRTSLAETAKTTAQGFGNKLQDKAAEARDSLQNNDSGRVVERTAIHEKRV